MGAARGSDPVRAADAQRAASPQYYLLANVLKACEDKTFPGAIVAGMASPWGQAVSAGDPENTYFGSYREVFARDLYEAWTGLIADGDSPPPAPHAVPVRAPAAARRLDAPQQPGQRQAGARLVRGAARRSGLPDPDGRPLGLDRRLALRHHISAAADSWSGTVRPSARSAGRSRAATHPRPSRPRSPGLVAAAESPSQRRRRFGACAWAWPTTTSAPSRAGRSRRTGRCRADPYFIRLSKTGDPNAAISYNVGNGGPTLDQRTVIDAGFLELPARRAAGQRSGRGQPHSRSSTPPSRISTPSGDGFHRYNGDGYGDAASDGHPWAPSGRAPVLGPALSVERGEYLLLLFGGLSTCALLSADGDFASGIGLIPEQFWDCPSWRPPPSAPI